MDFKKNEKYFNPVNLKFPIILIVIGLLLSMAMIGIPILIIGVILLILQFVGKPSDGDLDRQAHAEIANIKEEALSKLGLDESEVSLIEPIVFEGYDFRNISTQSWYKLGNDGRYRASNYSGTVFLFSENQVYFYQRRFSLINNEKQVNTDEYFYKDIVSASTSSESMTYTDKKGKQQTIPYEEFVLTTMGATKMFASIRVNDPSVEKSIKGMKNLLREKKTA